MTRVLLVEDDPADAAWAHSSLSTATVVHASSLAEATAALQGASFDLILADLYLPDCEGTATVRALIDRGRGTPVVVLTGYVHPTFVSEAIDAGAEDCVGKDSDPDVLLHAMGLALTRTRRRGDIRTLIEAGADPMLVIDHDGAVRFANLRAKDVFPGLARNGAVLGTPIGEDPISVEVITKRGVRTFDLLRSAIQWQARDSLLLTFRDVTERSLVLTYQERLFHMDRLGSIGQLAAGVAHEVNNPAMLLTTLLGELASSADGERRRDLEDCLHAVERIGEITQALTRFARRGTADQVEAIDVADVCRAASRITRPRLRSVGQFQLFAGELPPVRGVSHQLTQVVVNLLMNAADALDGHPGKGKITLRAVEVPGAVEIRVEDNGPGIRESIREQIFEPFFTTRPPGLGTGLGLSICRELLGSQGGTLSVRSDVGAGSTFTVRLPLGEPRPAVERPAIAQWRRPLILLVIADRTPWYDAQLRVEHVVLDAENLADVERQLAAHTLDAVVVDGSRRVQPRELQRLLLDKQAPVLDRVMWIAAEGDTRKIPDDWLQLVAPVGLVHVLEGLSALVGDGDR